MNKRTNEQRKSASKGGRLAVFTFALFVRSFVHSFLLLAVRFRRAVRMGSPAQSEDRATRSRKQPMVSAMASLIVALAVAAPVPEGGLARCGDHRADRAAAEPGLI